MSKVVVPDGAGHSLRFLEVDGFRYPDFPLESVRGVRDFEIRSDDVIVCAYPKSGNDVKLPVLTLKEKDEGMLELMSHVDLNAQPSPRVLNTHMYFEQLPRQVQSGCGRVVWLVRDPRDVAVSYYNHHRKLSELYDYHGDWAHYLPLFTAGQLDYGSWFAYHESWERGMSQCPDLHVLKVTYEDMKKDSMAAVRHLAKFLRIKCSEDIMAAIDKACSFESMRKAKGHIEVDESGQPIMYRKGKVGDWKTWFTVAQAEDFARLYRSKMSVPPLAGSIAASYDMRTA
nr:hypothetical protein BaRGS_015376 [Batillaria attramentaria]